jgi:exosortase
MRCIALAAVGACAASLVMWPAWVELAAAWRGSEAFHWGWLVLPLVVYLLGWHDRRANLALDPRPDLSGVLPCVLAAAVWLVADLMNLNVGRQLALVLALQGIAMSALGWRVYRQLFPTLALLFLMIPSADLLQPALRAATVQSIDLFASVAGLPHQVDGFVVLIGARRYVIVDECSGLAYVSLAMFLGYAFGLLLYRSAWKVAALALLGAGLGVLCNVVRVNAIVAIDWIRGSQMDLAAHGGIQWLALFALLGLLLYGLTRLPGEAATPPATVDQGASAGRWFGPVAAGAAVLLVVSGANAVLAPSATEGRTAATMPPAAVAGWSHEADSATWLIAPDTLTQSLEPRYRRGAQRVQAKIVQALATDAKLPALRALAGSGGHWREARTEALRHCDAARCVAFVHVTLQGRPAGQRRHVYAAYCADELITESSLAFRATHAWHRVTRQTGDRRAIALAVDGDGLAAEAAARGVRALQAALGSSGAPV